MPRSALAAESCTKVVMRMPVAGIGMYDELNLDTKIDQGIGKLAHRPKISDDGSEHSDTSPTSSHEPLQVMPTHFVK